MPAQHEVIAANAGLTALLSYDSVWTGYAQNPEFAARSPFTTLEVARAFRGAIGKAVNHAQAIATVASDGDYEAIAESLREALSTYESGQIALQAIDEHSGSVGQLARIGLTNLEESKTGEEKQLEADIFEPLYGTRRGRQLWRQILVRARKGIDCRRSDHGVGATPRSRGGGGRPRRCGVQGRRLRSPGTRASKKQV